MQRSQNKTFEERKISAKYKVGHNFKNKYKTTRAFHQMALDTVKSHY